MISENSKFERRHVLYCDILGFAHYSLSEFFEPSRCFRLFYQLDQLVLDSTKSIDPSLPDPETGQIPDYVIRSEATYCSDSIIISTPATTIDAIWLCEAAARIQNGLCQNGFALRGAIGTGDLYHSGNTIFGSAIVNAVAIEKSGLPPVIAISPETMESFHHATSPEDQEIINTRSQQLISHHECTKPFIDPFWILKCHSTQPVMHVRNRVMVEYWRSLIEHGLNHHDLQVVEKYRWLANHFNYSLCRRTDFIQPIPCNVIQG